MKIHRLEKTQFIGTSLQAAWDFFSDPRNLPVITPPDLGFRIASKLPERMHPGLLIEYRVTPFPPVSVKWITEITHMVEPILFVDEQRFGPYRLWHHQHHFRETAEGVEIRDLVTYALPFGVFGAAAAGLVNRRLDEIFRFRQQILAEKKDWR